MGDAMTVPGGTLDGIPAEGAPDAEFRPFGTPVTADEVAKRLSRNLYVQLSDGDDRTVLDAVSRAEVYIGTVLGYLGRTLDLDDRVMREIVLTQTVYELHMALGHEEAGREYRIQAKNTIVAAYGSFPDSDTQSRPDPGAAVVRPPENPRLRALHKARGFTL